MSLPAIDVATLIHTPYAWAIAVVALFVVAIIIKVAGLIVRILTLLVSLATIAWVILRARGH
ncbi:MAG TPA: hypothetical protein VE967_08235 [Gemmatimonadaceae bacterium]|nr:hypothetical protein [Gemmatimonadaceae bacterium]